MPDAVSVGLGGPILAVVDPARDDAAPIGLGDSIADGVVGGRGAVLSGGGAGDGRVEDLDHAVEIVIHERRRVAVAIGGGGLIADQIVGRTNSCSGPPSSSGYSTRHEAIEDVVVEVGHVVPVGSSDWCDCRRHPSGCEISRLPRRSLR